VDAFDGFSVGLGVGPGTLTVAIEEQDGVTTDLMAGAQEMNIACGGNSLGYGINFSGDVGVDLSFTYASGSASADPLACTTDNTSTETKGDSATANTMGLGVAIPIGGMSLAIDYESSGTTNKTGGTGTDVETKTTESGFEVSFTMPIADATLGFNISAHATDSVVDGTTMQLGAAAGTEVWYSVPIGAVTLAVGYGSSATAKGCADCVNAVSGAAEATVTTESVTEMGAEMSMSF